MAAAPEVAADQMEVPSIPTWFAKKPSAMLPFGLTCGEADISETLLPYDLMRAGVDGMIPSKRAPSLRAVRCSDPSSAVFRLFVDSVLPRLRNS